MSKSSHVAYLSYDGLTDPLGQAQIIPYVIGLSKHGFEFTIISFEKPERYRKWSAQINNLLSEHEIQWLPLRYTKSPPVLSTLWDVLKLWREVMKAHRQKDFKIVHCRSYITSLVGLRAKKNFKTKFIFDMRGFWADERVEGGLWDLRHPMYRMVYNYFKRKEREFLKWADHTVSLTESAKDEILTWGFKCSPISVIPTCVDLDFFNQSRILKDDQIKLREELNIKPDDFVILYLGSLGTWYLAEDMLSFFSEIKKQKPTAKFLIVTLDPMNLRDYAHFNDVIITQSPRNQVPLYISICHLAVCFIKPTFSKKASFPTKVGEILAMNIPVVVNRGWGDILPNAKGLGSLNIFNLNSSPEYVVYQPDRKIIAEFSLESGIKHYLTVYMKTKQA